jgi:Got1/Sft2-like family
MHLSASRCCCILLIAFTTAATAHDLLSWSLPSVPKQRYRDHRHFIDPRESLAVVLERVRGGSSYNDNNDDWSTYGAVGRNNNYEETEEEAYSRRRRQPEDDRYSRYADEAYDDYGRAPPPQRSSRSTSGIANALPKIIKQGDRKIGIALLASGLAITFLGISLFFNKTLLRLGNLLFIAGVPMTIGPTRTVGYFVRPEKMRATACLALGIFLVFVGQPVFGIILEVFGLLNLFANMFPIVIAIVQQMPVVGPLLTSANAKNNKKSYRKSNGRGQDDYYDDYGGRGYDDQGQQPAQQKYYDEDYREDEGSSVPFY